MSIKLVNEEKYSLAKEGSFFHKAMKTSKAPSGLLLGFLPYAKPLGEVVKKLHGVNGLGYMSVHAGVHTFLAVVAHGVGCHGDDG